MLFQFQSSDTNSYSKIILLGTILPWVPRPNKDTGNPIGIPECWVECNGQLITKGIWNGEKTPDLNEARRFIRGGPLSEALDSQEDSIQQHTHHINDPGHTHGYVYDFLANKHYLDDSFFNWVGKEEGEKGVEHSHRSTTNQQYSGVEVSGVNEGQYSEETRPKNMKVTFIMKVC